MGLFDRLRKKQEAAQEPKTVWEIKDINQFLIAMFDQVSEKCQYGADTHVLSEQEKVFLITQQVETEVNNGGFDQYFCNSSGDLANEAVRAFLAIGAEVTAEICRKALAAFGGPAPADRAERTERLLGPDGDSIRRLLEECDDMFYEYADDLNALNYAYIMANREYFT